jgi:hypothetical protein
MWLWVLDELSWDVAMGSDMYKWGYGYTVGWGGTKFGDGNRLENG